MKSKQIFFICAGFCSSIFYISHQDIKQKLARIKENVAVTIYFNS
ncbi:hypothetical protein HMPREF0653_01630 [Prevotella disiens JCM 6334 = ATCC 29426]|uniref:Uncharacterized protein n=2 Tax=Prevotella disiens TaxID=28130 RepID=E1KUI3_9BACT|nr:hypothetical protein HMPREF9296_0665 [Prevotella disiens FB035-09AN]ERJ76013.1 hypothetical protein HMPREF0653_01630 [Prevotella disiens JCM 6334 = ATCC 29426]